MSDFIPLLQHAAPGWASAEMIPAAIRPDALLMGDTELLMCAHFLPLVVAMTTTRPRVVALCAAPHASRPVFAEDGRWQAGYKPIVVRCLPFRMNRLPGSDPFRDLEIARDWPVGSPATMHPLRDGQGAASPILKAVHELLARHHRGAERLTLAADKLLLAGLLVPLSGPDGGPAPGNPQFMTVDSGKLKGLTPIQLAALARQDYLAIDLLSACLFSQRWLAPGLAPKPTGHGAPAQDPTASPAENAAMDQFSGHFSIMLDESELFDGLLGS